MRTIGPVAVCLLLGCTPELPPLEYRGERVIVGSDVVDQVCGGTLARLDRELEQIERRLQLPAQAEPQQVYIVAPETIAGYCNGRSCLLDPNPGAPFVLLNHGAIGLDATHELVHARLAHHHTVPLLTEGLADAIAPPACPRSMPDNLHAADFLTARNSSGLRKVFRGYYVAGELAAALLEMFGPTAFLTFYTDIDPGASASTITTKYREHFGRDIEDDLFTHVRTQAELDTLSPEAFGCLAPPPPIHAGVISLKATLECDAKIVNNTPGSPGKGYVEWTLSVEHNQRFELRGAVPDQTLLSVQDCGCEPMRGHDLYRLPRPFDPHATFKPGSYRLIWNGALDEGLALDVELVPVAPAQGASEL